MSEVHRFSVVKMLSKAGNKISYDPHGPEIVMAKDYDALAAKLAMAEDAAEKGDAARHAAGGMEMEIQELKAKLAELERQEPVATVAKVPGEDWNSLDFHRDLQDMQPGTKLYAAPVAQAQHSVPAYVSYTTRPAESLAGIALRQLKDESRWVEIRDINAHVFPDMQSHSYYPAGTVIKLPAAAPGKEGV